MSATLPEAGPAGTSILSYQDVVVRFGTTTAVAGVTLDVRAGERVALVGASGSGKTTLLSLASGLRRPTVGRVVRAPGLRLGMLLQDPVASLDPAWTVEQIVAEPLRDRPGPGRTGTEQARTPRREAVQRALAAVHLGGVDLDRRPAELSVGQCQRVALARALVAEPGLILADEPTSALDPSVAAGVLRLLDAALASTGAALLVVSHDVLAVGPLVDRLVVLHEGRIVEQGRPADLLARPTHAATVRLVETAQDLAVATGT
jgi:peptide/nickel transport system ATP-binding protein